ncbi:MAG: pyridoxamine 5'-phosphate oxidase family protein [Chloroflexi bacterium]|nr:pyridoxamine 5'-phosphate oxidase family protein [Chloroflexota bacterium]MBU1748697.1 pyridoxamine 5'-phosphate oxidase family protein [Chloroflexota bacterium]
MTSRPIPEAFIHWAYDERAELVRAQAAGESVPRDQFLLGFTRHSPALISNGSAGLNGSIKGVGFMPRAEYLDETVAAYLAHIQQGWREGYQRAGLALLLRYMWGPDCKERIDFGYLTTLELAGKHSYTNIQENPQVTLLYYQPPTVSFEVRGVAEIVRQGAVHTFVNAQHDVYHRPYPERWPERPAYVITIHEVWDNSNTRDGFGTRIM